MKKRIFACISALAVAAMASVNAFAYTIKPNKQSNEIVLVGENGIYSSASELSDLTEIKLTASTDHDPSALSGSFKVVCDDAAQTFKWTAENGDNVVFKMNDDSSMYEAVIEGIKIPEKCTEITLIYENDNETTLDLVGVELIGIDEPKKPEITTPSSSEVVSEEPSSVETPSSSETESSSEIIESSSQTETSSDSVKDENDSSNKPTGVGTGLALAGIAIAAAAVVSLKKSK